MEGEKSVYIFILFDLSKIRVLIKWRDMFDHTESHKNVNFSKLLISLVAKNLFNVAESNFIGLK